MTHTTAVNEMLKRVQHDKKKYVIPNLFRNLEFGNDSELIALVSVIQTHSIPFIFSVYPKGDMNSIESIPQRFTRNPECPDLFQKLKI